MIVVNIIILILVIGVLAFIINIAEDKELKKRKINISFREAMNLVELPVVTFYNKNKKLNFLLDTGSNYSQINKSVLPLLDYKKIDNQSTDIMGIEGNKFNAEFCELSINYKNKEYTDNFCINELDAVFDTIKQESGVMIHGILGSLFFQKYKYILDFKTLEFYIK